MSRIELLKKLLPGFLPIFIFILADEIWGTKIGLLVAIIFGLAQLVFTLIREKRVDKFVLFDTALILVLGLVSIYLENEIFFKLKPAFIGFIFVFILGISAFSKLNIMAVMSQRYIKDVSINDIQIKQMNKSVKILFIIFLLHSMLVLYSAFYMSKEAWAFISGGLFYIIFAGYFVFEFVKNKFRLKHLKSEEWLPIVDEDGNVKAKAPRSICHRNKELLHPVVHLHVVNKKGEFFLQKRPANKLIQPDKWDTSVGGHVSFNETIEQALKKEAIEELGIVDFKPIFVKKYIWESDVERELVFMFYTQYEGIVKINKNELADGKFWRILDIDNQINKDIFTPNFLKEFEIIRTYLS